MEESHVRETDSRVSDTRIVERDWKAYGSNLETEVAELKQENKDLKEIIILMANKI